MEGRVLSGIEAIEPRIIRTGEQKAAIFERGIGERNYILWNRAQWGPGAVIESRVPVPLVNFHRCRPPLCKAASRPANLDRNREGERVREREREGENAY